jgi:hypothetical protein
MFSTMRSFTGNVLREYNRRILKLIEDNPALEGHFRAVRPLRDHLLLWLAKYEGTFVNTPEMCLLYTGVEEGVPFPSELEPQLWRFLADKPGASGLLQVEPDSPLEFEEHSSMAHNWQVDERLFNRWVRRRFQEIPSERDRLLEGASTAGSGDTAHQLKELDIEEAGLIERKMYPQIIWRPIPVPEALLASLRVLLEDEASSGWPEDFRKALTLAAPAVSNPFPGAFDLKSLVLQLPVISSYVGTLAISSDLPSKWARFRAQLKDWVLAAIQLDIPDRRQLEL